MEHSPTPTRRPWSVRAHLWAVVAVAAVLVVGTLGYGYAWTSERAERRASDAMTAHATVAADEISRALRAGADQVTNLATTADLAGAAGPGDCTVLVGESDAFPGARLDVVRPGGEVRCSSMRWLAGLPTDVHGAADWLPPALASSGVSTSWPVRDPLTGRPVVLVTHPFRAPDGTPGGVVALFLDVGGAARALAPTQALPADAALTVVDLTDGSVLSTSSPRVAGTAPDGSTTAAAGLRRSGRWAGPDGVVRQHASADVALLPWRVYAGVDQADVAATARGMLARQSLTGAGAVLALAFALWVVDRRIAGPLHTLTRSVVRARDDADDTRVPETGTAELVELARAYNSMLDVRAGQRVRLEHQATHDRLTGLPDGDWARARLDLALSHSPSPPGGTGRVGVLHVGLNRFGTIATGIGPAAADHVLVEVAARLRSQVGPGHVLARAGSEGFLVLCEDVTADEAVALAEQIHHAVARPMDCPAPDVVVHVTTGIDLDDGERTAESMLRGASAALAHAQARGRVWSIFDGSMQVRAAHQLRTEQRLREALDRDELVVHYQPIVELATGRIAGAEALVRWQDPVRGLVPPLHFIPVAEESGQIAAIGTLVLTRACREAAGWLRRGRPFVVSVNVAAAQLDDDGFADEVDAVLRDTGLPPESLCLEVTESAVVRRAGNGVENLHRLRRQGVHVAVDDFGTGYSSLSYLRHLPISALKIDRSFVTRIEHDERDRHLVEAVLGMARALGLTVVAEGVETTGQQDVLVGLGCASAQGYLWSKPCRPEELGALLARSPVG